MSSDFDFIKKFELSVLLILFDFHFSVFLDFAQMTREQGNLGEDDLRMEIINEGFCFIYAVRRAQ